jgi:carbon storage regulator
VAVAVLVAANAIKPFGKLQRPSQPGLVGKGGFLPFPSEKPPLDRVSDMRPRKTGEEIVIGNNIQVTVVAIKAENVRLGISAPEEVTVDRLEVHEKRQNLLKECTEPEIYKTGP